MLCRDSISKHSGTETALVGDHEKNEHVANIMSRRRRHHLVMRQLRVCIGLVSANIAIRPNNVANKNTGESALTFAQKAFTSWCLYMARRCLRSQFKIRLRCSSKMLSSLSKVIPSGISGKTLSASRSRRSCFLQGRSSKCLSQGRGVKRAETMPPPLVGSLTRHFSQLSLRVRSSRWVGRNPDAFKTWPLIILSSFPSIFSTCVSFEEDPGSLTKKRGQRVQVTRKKTERN